jgi:hypothetical protein
MLGVLCYILCCLGCCSGLLKPVMKCGVEPEKRCRELGKGLRGLGAAELLPLNIPC